MNFLENTQELLSDTFTGSCFGENKQLKVIGYFYKTKYIKVYAVECSICKEDSELYGAGIFLSVIGHLNSGKMPCGCSPVPKWNENQQILRCKRAALRLGYDFIGIAPDETFSGQTTKILVSCKTHGIWGSKIVSLANLHYGCRKCADEINSIRNRKPDDVMIKSFFSSGAFHPETQFQRSERKTSGGSKNYWTVSCPVCGETGEALSGDLKKGNQPCACFNNQKQAYINYIKQGDELVAIKFGIAKCFKNRVDKQNRLSVYSITNYGVWDFPTKSQCYSAELECKQTLPCGIVSKQDMQDGWTETVCASNLNSIVSIFEKHGGIPHQPPIVVYQLGQVKTNQ